MTKKVIYEYRSPWASLLGKVIVWTLMIVLFVNLAPWILIFGLLFLAVWVVLAVAGHMRYK